MADDMARAPPAVAQTELPPEIKAAETARAQQRKRLFTMLAGAGALLVVAFAIWWLLVASHYVSTDDAYVGADVAQVTPLVGGAVKAVDVAETQAVKAGDVLVELDPADATLAAQRAEANYQATLRKFRGDTATVAALSAQVAARAADVARAQAEVAVVNADVAKAKIDYDRRQALANTGAVSGEELTTAKTAYENAKSNLMAAQAAADQAAAGQKTAESQVLAQQVMIEGASDTNPEVVAARSARDAAQLDLQRTVIRSPVDGIVSRRLVELGQRVQVGSPMMSIVPSTVYVDANFKEAQLRKVRAGQPATMEADIYGGGVVYHGQVVGIGGGTGSAFALIPAQNATGNWIKVVQRLPVRIRIDADDLAKHPLRLGLSMKAKIDVSGSAKAAAGG
jgi:membrane fusion protein (multidrug efflux system)